MQAPAVIAILRGPEHRFELVNPGYQALFKGRKLLGLPLQEAMPEIKGQGYSELLDKVYATGESHVGREARVMLDRASNGNLEEAFFNFVYQPMVANDGQIDGIIVFGFEVTAQVIARRRGEQELRESEEMFRLLVETVEDYAIFMIDPEGRVASWNAGARHAKGYEANEVIGRHFSIFYPEEDVRQGKPERLLAIAREQGRVEDEGWRVRKDGTKFWADAVITAVHDQHGNLRGFAKVTRDVTERRKAEETQRSLLVSEEVNRAKDDFLAVISHELRTPLTSILGWARLLRIGGLDEKTMEEALSALERSAQAQVHLIEDLLDDTRMTSGKLRLNKRLLQIGSVVQSALADLGPSAEVKGIQLISDLQCDECPMFADPTRLQQVVWNVVANAIKFTPENGRVFVRAKRNGATAEIEVRDEGRGIDSELLPQLFQRYRQGDASTSRKSGVGLGLAISKYLVEQHDGTIQAASEGPGKGATFTISLPLTTETSDAFKQRDLNRAELLADLAGVRVLLVEDQADNRDVLSKVIERCGAEVRCASTGSEALQILESWSPDVIVCDIALPDTDGCALLQQMRARIDTPALALTVFGSSEEEARVRASGFDVFRQKPIEPADLAHEIERLAHAASRH
ncbi:MAG: ATP-binding protein [Acidobacteriota bacterium]|nr:ATP-binding protein [Acidobacteriota bacterium]